MLLANDHRDYVDANPAACALLGLTGEEIRSLRVEDLAAPSLRSGVAAAWSEFLRAGWMAGSYKLRLFSGQEIEIEFSATANISPGLHLSVMHAHRRAGEGTTGGQGLTQREREVMTMLAMGASTREIAEGLVIGDETVRTHIRRAVHKLGARNRAHAVAIALSKRLIEFAMKDPDGLSGAERNVPQNGDIASAPGGR